MYGKMSVIYTVHCGGCSTHYTAQNGEQTRAASAGNAAKRIGWERTRAFGWLCPACADNTVAVIMNRKEKA